MSFIVIKNGTPVQCFESEAEANKYMAAALVDSVFAGLDESFEVRETELNSFRGKLFKWAVNLVNRN